ncbi:MAG TPA: hypothetical protein VKR06_21880 [Ktedonosporobacter sp.]|nr:hypothetical protein [Ktedonosporobacter sp.]
MRMRRTNSLSPSMRTRRQTGNTVCRPALLDRPPLIPGNWPNLCPAGLGRPGIEPPFLQ